MDRTTNLVTRLCRMAKYVTKNSEAVMTKGLAAIARPFVFALLNGGLDGI
jgi:hypothetical protein